MITIFWLDSPCQYDDLSDGGLVETFSARWRATRGYSRRLGPMGGTIREIRIDQARYANGVLVVRDGSS